MRHYGSKRHRTKRRRTTTIRNKRGKGRYKSKGHRKKGITTRKLKQRGGENQNLEVSLQGYAATEHDPNNNNYENPLTITVNPTNSVAELKKIIENEMEKREDYIPIPVRDQMIILGDRVLKEESKLLKDCVGFNKELDTILLFKALPPPELHRIPSRSESLARRQQADTDSDFDIESPSKDRKSSFAAMMSTPLGIVVLIAMLVAIPFIILRLK